MKLARDRDRNSPLTTHSHSYRVHANFHVTKTALIHSKRKQSLLCEIKPRPGQTCICSSITLREIDTCNSHRHAHGESSLTPCELSDVCGCRLEKCRKNLWLQRENTHAANCRVGERERSRTYLPTTVCTICCHQTVSRLLSCQSHPLPPRPRKTDGLMNHTPSTREKKGRESAGSTWMQTLGGYADERQLRWQQIM